MFVVSRYCRSPWFHDQILVQLSALIGKTLCAFLAIFSQQSRTLIMSACSTDFALSISHEDEKIKWLANLIQIKKEQQLNRITRLNRK